MLEEDERRHSSRFSARNSTIFCAPLPSSSIFTVSPRAGGSPSESTSRLRAGLAELRRVDAEVGRGEALLRLLLRAHDPLQRRVARLVDRVGHRDDRGQRRLDHVVAELRLPLHARLAVRDRELRRLRDERQAQPVGDGGPEHGAVGVARLLPEEDQVGAFALERLREREARRDEIGARGRVVADEHGAVGAHREPLAQRVERALRAERHEHDLAVAAASFTRSASSIAFASNAFSAASPERSSRFVPGSMRFACASGTCLTHTAIFIARTLTAGIVG